METLVGLLSAMVALMGPLFDLLSAFEAMGAKYDQALSSGRQYQRGIAALTEYLWKEEQTVGEAGSRGLVERMSLQTEGSVDIATLSSMAAEAVAWGVTDDPNKIADLARVAWVRASISPTGAGQTMSEKTAIAFQEILDALASADVQYLSGRGFMADETAFEGLSGQQLVDTLLDEVLKDPVRDRLAGRYAPGYTGESLERDGLQQFGSSPYEQTLVWQADAMARMGELEAGSRGFWYELSSGSISVGPYDAALLNASYTVNPQLFPGDAAPAQTGLGTGAVDLALEAMRPHWLAEAGSVVDEILAEVRKGITPDVVKTLALRLFPYGIPVLWPGPQTGVLSGLHSTGGAQP